MIKQLSDVAGLLKFFHDRFDSNTATDEDLEFLAFSGEEASASAVELGDLLSGIGVLISSDEEKNTCGAFRDKGGVPELLWMISSRLREIGQATYIASESEFALRERYRARAEALAKVQEDSDRAIIAQAAASCSQAAPMAVGRVETAATKEASHA